MWYNPLWWVDKSNSVELLIMGEKSTIVLPKLSVIDRKKFWKSLFPKFKKNRFLLGLGYTWIFRLEIDLFSSILTKE